MSLVESAAAASDGAFDSIPVINIRDASTPERRASLAHEIRSACINVGFFYITGHGIPQETIDNLVAAMESYFSLPLETKMKLHHKEIGPNFKGYNPPLGSNVDPANMGDIRESFFTPDSEELVSTENEGAMTATNVWPSEPAGFRDAFLDYFHVALGVGRLLFRLFALALDLPETPRTTGPVSDGYVGIGAHSDFECFAMLWQQPDIQALQILNSEKQWINATPIPGTLVINIGDQLARWTNDIFRSTVHRATNRTGVHRYSVVLFIGSDRDVSMEAIPSCVSADRPSKYETITAGDYLAKRLDEMYYKNMPPA
ncbi:hypothetical protein SCLCIDRAFT_18973 [Scleroderma citrinum Foug A]|uniref:Fe2OG dioxygenase domain-containing protein n=1 Tax=Scleroderma citrinum Foug A TaxID=1036808 RepID=A0A0C3EQ45_9AGAM|nr:hypothetical protein SCLCIDRAFT_18973 [Scleroderma citrinum Foug A]